MCILGKINKYLGVSLFMQNETKQIGGINELTITLFLETFSFIQLGFLHHCWNFPKHFQLCNFYRIRNETIKKLDITEKIPKIESKILIKRVDPFIHSSIHPFIFVAWN